MDVPDAFSLLRHESNFCRGDIYQIPFVTMVQVHRLLGSMSPCAVDSQQDCMVQGGGLRLVGLRCPPSSLRSYLRAFPDGVRRGVLSGSFP